VGMAAGSKSAILARSKLISEIKIVARLPKLSQLLHLDPSTVFSITTFYHGHFRDYY
jgi:hypothetical protein